MPRHNTDAASRRITVNLTRRAWEAKDRLLRCGVADSVTDAVSRSLVHFDAVSQEPAGTKVILRRPDGSEAEMMML